MKWTRIFLLILSASLYFQSHAADDSDSDRAVEEIYEKFGGTKKSENEKRLTEKVEFSSQQDLTQLAKLSSFSDVAVIQRRFLPKTGRFEISGHGFTSLNNPFFNTLGLGLETGYYFKEQYAIELMYLKMTSSARDVTKDLRSRRNLSTSTVVTPDSYMGAAFKWNPIYGKMTFLNEKIIPFDMSFSFGGGVTQTNQDQSVGTFHFGAAQVFALSKSFALRWDVFWNYYQAEVKLDNGQKGQDNHSDLMLSLGVSFYFPEVNYR